MLTCPVPDCNESNFGRQTDVNAHLRTSHDVPLEYQRGGNVGEQRRTQQRQFTEWLQENGYQDADSVRLFIDGYGFEKADKKGQDNDQAENGGEQKENEKDNDKTDDGQ